MNLLYLKKLYIRNYYHGVIGIFLKSNIKAKMLKTEGLGENQIAYMKHIKIQSCHMGVIFIPKHMIWQRRQCVHIHSQIMHYPTVNLSCDVVPNVQKLIFLTKKNMINMLTLYVKSKEGKRRGRLGFLRGAPFIGSGVLTWNVCNRQ